MKTINGFSDCCFEVGTTFETRTVSEYIGDKVVVAVYQSPFDSDSLFIVYRGVGANEAELPVEVEAGRYRYGGDQILYPLTDEEFDYVEHKLNEL